MIILNCMFIQSLNLREWNKSFSLTTPISTSPYHLRYSTYTGACSPFFICVPFHPQPATNCSTQFPVLNYTVSIEGLEGSLTVEDASDYSSALSVVLSSFTFPELIQDQQYSIVITACITFTCRSPPDALLAGKCCTHI